MSITLPTIRLTRDRSAEQMQKRLEAMQRKAMRVGAPVVEAEPRESFFHQAVNFLNRPQQALFQLIESIQAGEDPDQTISEIWDALKGDTERIVFADLLRTAGMHDGKLLWAAGLAGDFVIDPLNLLPLGAASKVTKAARIRLLANPSGRAALTWLAEAKRGTIMKGGHEYEIKAVKAIDTYLHKFFSTIPNLGPKAANERTQTVLRELKELEERGFFALTEMPSPRGYPLPAMKLAGEITPEKIMMVKESTKRLAMIRTMMNYRKHGHTPWRALSEFLHYASKNSKVASKVQGEDFMMGVGNFFRKFVSGASNKDELLMSRFAEEFQITDPIARTEMVGKILARADDPEKVERAGRELSAVFESVLDMGKRGGIAEAVLGGGLRAQRFKIFNQMTKVMDKLSLEELKESAKTIRRIGWGSDDAQRQATAFADIIEASGSKFEALSKSYDVLHHSPALMGEMPFQLAGKKFTKAYLGHAAATDAWSEWVSRASYGPISHLPGAGVRIKAMNKRLEALKELAEVQDRLPGFFPHYVAPEDVQRLMLHLKKRPDHIRKLGSPAHRSMIERRVVDNHGRPLSMEEYVEILSKKEDELAAYGEANLRRHSIKEFFRGNPRAEADYMGLDPVSGMALRGLTTVKAIGRKEFRDDMVRYFGRSKSPAAVTIERLGFESEHKFHPEIARAIETMQEAYFGDAATQSFLRWWDDLQGIWKAFQLFPFAAYHTRNHLSDLYLMACGGFFTKPVREDINPIIEPFWQRQIDWGAFTDYVKAMRIQMHATTQNVDGLSALKHVLRNGRSYDGNEIFTMTRQRGGLDIGFFSDNYTSAAQAEARTANVLWENGRMNTAALGDAARSVADLRTFFTPSQVPRNALIRGGRATAAALSNTNRLAFVMKRLRWGDTIDDAVRHSNKWLLDYTDLTPFETQVMRRVFPFYTWTRKNLPRQMEVLLNNPQRFARIERSFRAARDPNSPAQPFLTFLNGEGTGLQEHDNPQPIDIPRWMREAVSFPLRRNAAGELEMMPIRAWLPAAEIEAVAPSMQQLGKTFMDMLSPVLKTPLETFTQRSFFFDRDLEGQAEFMGVMMPATVANIFHNFRLLDEFDRMNWLAEYGFTTRQLRPESEESQRQKWWRLFSGMKVYPLDTRMAKIRNLAGPTDLQRRYLKQWQEAQRRARVKKQEEEE